MWTLLRKFSLTFFLLLLASLLGAFSGASAQTISRIAAVVNQDIITTHELDQKVAESLADDKQLTQLPASQRRQLRRQVLSKLIEETLIKQKVQELDLEVREKELEAAVNDVLRKNRLTKEQLKQALQAQGMSFTAYRDQIRQQIQRMKLITREVKSQVDVTDAEIKDYFQEHPEEFGAEDTEPKVCLSRVSFPQGQAPQTELQEKAKEARQKLQQGESINAVVSCYQGDYQSEGGELGYFKPEELNPSIAKAVADLQAGEVSDVISTPQGLHVFKVVERTSGSQISWRQFEEQIRQKLRQQKMDDKLSSWAEELKEDAYVDIRL